MLQGSDVPCTEDSFYSTAAGGDFSFIFTAAATVLDASTAQVYRRLSCRVTAEISLASPYYIAQTRGSIGVGVQTGAPKTVSTAKITVLSRLGEANLPL